MFSRILVDCKETSFATRETKPKYPVGSYTSFRFARSLCHNSVTLDEGKKHAVSFWKSEPHVRSLLKFPLRSYIYEGLAEISAFAYRQS
jgi:hypothetical protein